MTGRIYRSSPICSNDRPNSGGSSRAAPFFLAVPYVAESDEPMAPRETTLEMVARHVRAGRDHIDQPRMIIKELRALGHPTKEAECLLARLLEI